jgi:hypothetical protein
MNKKKINELSEHNKVVTQTVCTRVNFNDDVQEIRFIGCVQKIYVSIYYGEFELYDSSNRLLGKSTKSKLSCIKINLQTEASRVWYDAVCITCKQYKDLKDKYNVSDPGLSFNNTSKIYIKFLQSLHQPMKYYTIPVFYTVTNVWNDQDKILLYN